MNRLWYVVAHVNVFSFKYMHNVIGRKYCNHQLLSNIDGMTLLSLYLSSNDLSKQLWLYWFKFPPSWALIQVTRVDRGKSMGGGTAPSEPLSSEQNCIQSMLPFNIHTHTHWIYGESLSFLHICVHILFMLSFELHVCKSNLWHLIVTNKLIKKTPWKLTNPFPNHFLSRWWVSFSFRWGFLLIFHKSCVSW